MEDFGIEQNLVSFTISFTEEGGRCTQTEIYHCPETEELSRMLLGISEVLRLMVEDEENWISCDRLDRAREEDFECHMKMVSLAKESYGCLLEKAYDSGYEDMPVMAAILFKMIAVFLPEMKEMIKGKKRVEVQKHCDTLIKL